MATVRVCVLGFSNEIKSLEASQLTSAIKQHCKVQQEDGNII